MSLSSRPRASAQVSIATLQRGNTKLKRSQTAFLMPVMADEFTSKKAYLDSVSVSGKWCDSESTSALAEGAGLEL